MKRHYLTSKIVVLAYLALFTLAAKASNALDPATTQAVERILSNFASPDKPALAITVIRGGKPILERALGSVDLESKAPATVDTKFQVDSLAWEFIAHAVFMMEEQGKVTLDDDIRQYLPGLPALGRKITIKHLLSSTDGLYGYKTLQSLAGWGAGEPAQYKDIVQLLQSQKQTNFNPGEAFSPGGDTRLILLARIVEVASGQAFDAFCKSQIFVPLGMSNTIFVYGSGRPLQNTAVPYRLDGSGVLQRDDGPVNVAGPVNLYSSIRDMSIWRAWIASPPPGKQSLVNKLGMPIRLDNGSLIKDVSGITTFGQQHAGQERGLPKVYRIASFGGYASSVFHFPGNDLAVVVLSSGLTYSGYVGMQIANILLSDRFPEPPNIDYAKIKAVDVPPQQLQLLEGTYWDATRGRSARVEVKDKVLHYTRPGETEGRVLIPLDDSSFQMKIDGDDSFFVRFMGNKKSKSVHYTMSGSDPIVFEQYTPVTYTKDELGRFAGTFYNKDLNASFVLDASSGTLVADNRSGGIVTFSSIGPDKFAGDKRFMGGITFVRGKKGEITGLRVVVDEVRNLVFQKLRDDGGQGISAP
ncbi:serine hydrolase domain-containing protein [Massilia violaceinigra]|nr:serine hydrolase domain-containing protein [Massilia violaceinigra]